MSCRSIKRITRTSGKSLFPWGKEQLCRGSSNADAQEYIFIKASREQQGLQELIVHLPNIALRRNRLLNFGA